LVVIDYNSIISFVSDAK